MFASTERNKTCMHDWCDSDLLMRIQPFHRLFLWLVRLGAERGYSEMVTRLQRGVQDASHLDVTNVEPQNDLVITFVTRSLKSAKNWVTGNRIERSSFLPVLAETWIDRSSFLPEKCRKLDRSIGNWIDRSSFRQNSQNWIERSSFQHFLAENWIERSSFQQGLAENWIERSSFVSLSFWQISVIMLKNVLAKSFFGSEFAAFGSLACCTPRCKLTEISL